MKSGVQDYELPQIIESLKDTNEEVVQDSLKELCSLTKAENASEIVPHFRNLFEQLAVLLPETSQGIAVHSSQLLFDILNQFPEQTEPFFDPLCPKVIQNLGDSKVKKSLFCNLQPVIRKMALNILTSYIRLTKNFDLVFASMIKFGIDNPDVILLKRFDL